MTDKHKEAFIANYKVSRETLTRLELYEELIKKWNPAINLVSKGSLGFLWQRHFHDSAQIFKFKAKTPCNWADFGSGGGFPGIILAILAIDSSADSHFTLVESDVRKSTFLRTVIRDLGLNATVITNRIEKIKPLNADIITARALASLDKLLEYAVQHLNEDGVAIFLKGERYRLELKDALARWDFTVEEHTSETNPQGAILKIGGISLV